MNNCEEILIAIKTIMVKMFEIDEQAITLEAHLYEDLVLIVLIQSIGSPA